MEYVGWRDNLDMIENSWSMKGSIHESQSAMPVSHPNKEGMIYNNFLINTYFIDFKTSNLSYCE